MPLHCTMVNAGRQIGGYPIRQYKPPPSALRSATSLAQASDSADVIALPHSAALAKAGDRAAHRLAAINSSRPFTIRQRPRVLPRK
jgi:hypothetical protein